MTFGSYDEWKLRAPCPDCGCEHCQCDPADFCAECRQRHIYCECERECDECSDGFVRTVDDDGNEVERLCEACNLAGEKGGAK